KQAKASNEQRESSNVTQPLTKNRERANKCYHELQQLASQAKLSELAERLKAFPAKELHDDYVQGLYLFALWQWPLLEKANDELLLHKAKEHLSRITDLAQVAPILGPIQTALDCQAFILGSSTIQSTRLNQLLPPSRITTQQANSDVLVATQEDLPITTLKTLTRKAFISATKEDWLELRRAMEKLSKESKYQPTLILFRTLYNLFALLSTEEDTKDSTYQMTAYEQIVKGIQSIKSAPENTIEPAMLSYFNGTYMGLLVSFPTSTFWQQADIPQPWLDLKNYYAEFEALKPSFAKASEIKNKASSRFNYLRSELRTKVANLTYPVLEVNVGAGLLIEKLDYYAKYQLASPMSHPVQPYLGDKNVASLSL
ncbi:MAG: hypothetical protein ACK4M7_10025, partial [Burkholderiales bacterium]